MHTITHPHLIVPTRTYLFYQQVRYSAVVMLVHCQSSILQGLRGEDRAYEALSIHLRTGREKW